MESLAADKKSSLDLVQVSIVHLIRHCETNAGELESIDVTLSAWGMQSKLEMYETKLVQLPAIVAGYLNPQMQKPTDPTKLKELKTTIRAVLKNRYSDKFLDIVPPASEQQSNTNLCQVFFSSSCGNGGANGGDGEEIAVGDEVDRYLEMGVVVSQTFMDVVQWWMVRKEQLPAHYHMAMDYLGTPATSTPSERVNSMAGREFTAARQSLSSDIFIKTMCLRSWIKAGVVKIPPDRHKAFMSVTRLPAAGTIDEVVNAIEVEQQEWVEEVLDDGAIAMLNTQFNHLLEEEQDVML